MAKPLTVDDVRAMLREALQKQTRQVAKPAPEPPAEAEPLSLVEVESPEGLLVLVEEEPADEVADEPPAPAAPRRRRRKGE